MLAIGRTDGFPGLPQIGSYLRPAPHWSHGQRHPCGALAAPNVDPTDLPIQYAMGVPSGEQCESFSCVDDAIGFAAQVGYDIDSAAMLLDRYTILLPSGEKEAQFISLVEVSASSGSELLDPNIQTHNNLDRMRRQ